MSHDFGRSLSGSDQTNTNTNPQTQANLQGGMATSPTSPTQGGRRPQRTPYVAPKTAGSTTAGSNNLVGSSPPISSHTIAPSIVQPTIHHATSASASISWPPNRPDAGDRPGRVAVHLPSSNAAALQAQAATQPSQHHHHTHAASTSAIPTSTAQTAQAATSAAVASTVAPSTAQPSKNVDTSASSASSDSLPSMLTPGSHGSPKPHSRNSSELITTTSIVQPRFDPNSPQVASSRPLPKVVHRSTSISGPGGAVLSSPTNKGHSPPQSSTQVPVIKRNTVVNINAAVSGPKSLGLHGSAGGHAHDSHSSSSTSLIHPRSPPRSPSAAVSKVLTPMVPQLSSLESSPPPWDRAVTQGAANPYSPPGQKDFPIMVVGTPPRTGFAMSSHHEKLLDAALTDTEQQKKREAQAGSHDTTTTSEQQKKRDALGLNFGEPADVKRDREEQSAQIAAQIAADGSRASPSVGERSNSNNPTPSPSSKRAHQSWSVPARGSVSGGSGFSSSSFRPMLQKDLILAGQTGTGPGNGSPVPHHGHHPSTGSASTGSGTGSIPSPSHVSRPSFSVSSPSGGGAGEPKPTFAKLASLQETSVSHAGGTDPSEVRLHIGTGTPAATVAAATGSVTSPRAFTPVSKAAVSGALGAGSVVTPIASRVRASTASLPSGRTMGGYNSGFERVGGGNAQTSFLPSSPKRPQEQQKKEMKAHRWTLWEIFSAKLNSFPTRIPYSKSVALGLFHPLYIAVMFLLSLIGVFALDFTLGFFSKSHDLGCDILLLVIGSLWILELLILSIVLPGYLFSHFWWWMDGLSILSLVVDISLLRGLGMERGIYSDLSVENSHFLTNAGTSFHGLNDQGYGKLWLFLHYARLVRLFKYWNGLEALGNAGSFSLNEVFQKIAKRQKAGSLLGASNASDSSSSGSGSSSAAAFHKNSTLGLHLTNKLQKQLTLVFLCVTMLFTLLFPYTTPVNNNAECQHGGVGVFTKFSSQQQWTIAYLDSLYQTASKNAAASGGTPTQQLNAIQMHPAFQQADAFAKSYASGLGENVLYVALQDDSSTSMYKDPMTLVPLVGDIDSYRSIDFQVYSCGGSGSGGGSVLVLSNQQQIHEVACWNILLLICLFILFVIAQSFSAFSIASSISHPLERMSKVVRKMAGTVLFLQSDLEAEKDPWEVATTPSEGGFFATGNSNNAQGGRRVLSSSSSSWYLTNKSTMCALNVLGGWVAPVVPAHYEFDILEEVVTKMSSVFNLLPGGLSSLLENGSGEDKARRMMVGSKRTEIKTRDSILTIDVVERPITQERQKPSPVDQSSPNGPIGGHSRAMTTGPDLFGGSRRNLSTSDHHEEEFFSSSTLLNLPAMSPKLALSTMQNPAGRASIHHALPANSELRFESHPELRSLEDLLSDPFASIHFKQYLHKKFCLETITFYEQVTKFKARMQSMAFRIFHQFVVAGAPNEINIHSAQRQSISQEIFHPTLDIFNSAQKEVYKLMKNNFLEFLVSQACYQYLTAKSMKQLTIKVGEDHI